LGTISFGLIFYLAPAIFPFSSSGKEEWIVPFGIERRRIDAEQ
jgi:hypothetical protein